MPRLAVLVLLAFALAAGGCASSGAVPRPFPHPGGPGGVSRAPASPPPSAAPGDSTGYAIAGTALSLRGAPYRDGGSDPAGFDCSGFVRYVFARNGVTVPRTVSEQFRAGLAVAPDRLQPGDLVFFTTVAPDASHVGIAIGGDEFVHAPSERGEVRVEHLSSSYWRARFVGARHF
jgi:cell wall-associated NlpC family hydrolase